MRRSIKQVFDAAREELEREGRNLGYLQAQRRLLLRLLYVRFGSDVPYEHVERVCHASRSELDRMLGCLLGSAEPAEIFASQEEVPNSTANQIRAQGYTVGYLAGTRDFLSSSLCHSFGREASKEFQARVDRASVPELEAWAERVLGASTVAEVFGPASS